MQRQGGADDEARRKDNKINEKETSSDTEDGATKQAEQEELEDNNELQGTESAKEGNPVHMVAGLQTAGGPELNEEVQGTQDKEEQESEKQCIEIEDA